MRVNYITENGMAQIREVPDNADPRSYRYGIVVGPPDLSELPLTERQVRELTKALAENGFGDYYDTRGKRGKILDIIKKIVGERDKNLLQQILSIYQVGIFEE